MMNRCLEISKAVNGYVVSCTVPLKPDAKQTDKMMSCSMSADRQYIAKDAQEVADLVEDIMPLLDGDYKTEDDFDKAFEQATSDMNPEEKAEDS